MKKIKKLKQQNDYPNSKIHTNSKSIDSKNTTTNNNTNNNNSMIKSKDTKSSSKGFCKSTIPNVVDLNNEITKYYLLKNKLYILIENRKKEILLFSVYKLKIVHDFTDSMKSKSKENNNIINKTPEIKEKSKSEQEQDFNKIVEKLELYSNDACKSWFNIDIKLGSLRINFTKEIFSWKGEYLFDYLEYIKNSTKGFTVNSENFDDKKIFQSSSSDKYNNTISGGVRSLVIDKQKTPGYHILNNLISYYFLEALKDEDNEELEESFIQEYFSNTKKYLELPKNYSNKIEQKKLHPNNPKNLVGDVATIYDFDSLFLYSVKEKKVYPMFFKSKSNKIFNTKNSIYSDFEYRNLPSYIREIMNDPTSTSFNNSNKSTKPQKKKFDVVINCIKYNDFIKDGTTENNGETDEIEAGLDVSVSRLKEWILEKYIDKSQFHNRVNKEICYIEESNIVRN